MQYTGLRWSCLVQKNNLGNDVNDGFERDEKKRKTLTRHTNNPTEGGWWSKQDDLVGLEKKEAELVPMGENNGYNLKTDPMLGENTEISASPRRWRKQRCAERKKWMGSILWRHSGSNFWQVGFEVLWRHPNKRCQIRFWGNSYQPQKKTAAVTWVQMQCWIDPSRKVAFLSVSSFFSLLHLHVTLFSLLCLHVTVVGMPSMACHMLGKCSVTELYPQPTQEEWMGQVHRWNHHESQGVCCGHRHRRTKPDPWTSGNVEGFSGVGTSRKVT